MHNTELKNSALFVTIATVILYIYGLIFHQSYVSYWGLEESQFQVGFERILFKGFSALTQAGAFASYGLLLFSILTFVVVAIASVVESKFEVSSFFTRFKRTDADSVENLPFYNQLNMAGRAVLISIWSLFGVIILALLLIVPNYFGRESAKMVHENMDSGKVRISKLELKDGSSSKGYPIICSGNFCAYYFQNSVLVLNMGEAKSAKSKIKSP